MDQELCNTHKSHNASICQQNLEQWSLRMSWLDLQLMFNQYQNGSSELSAWLDTVARAVINVFQQPAPPPPDKDRYCTQTRC